MTSTRSTSRRHPFRAATLVLLTGAGIAFTPLAAPADTGRTVVGAAAPVAAVAAPARNATAQRAVDVALAQRGKPYEWGAEGPDSYDCSGLVYMAYRAAGVQLPRTSRVQATAGVEIPWYEMQAGDLIFFYTPVSHVGMSIGNGLMVHSSTYGRPVSVVRVASMPSYHSTRRIA